MTEHRRDSFWRDRPVLVTGATGFLGSCLTRVLWEAGANIVALVRDWVPQSELCRTNLIGRIQVVRGEVQDQGLLERVLGEYEVETVFHLAAQTIVTIANRNPVSTFESNIQGSWSLLEACRRSPRLKQIVFASSDKAYGNHAQLPYREDVPLKGTHPYDVSKSCADLLAQSYAQTYKLPIVIARCGNLYGAGDLNWNRLIPGTIRSVIRQQPPIIRSDGSLTRDYFYVEDGAAAYLQLAEHLAADLSLMGEAFNFSNEHPLTVLEITRRILMLMKRDDLKPVIQNQASSEIPHQYLDAAKAHERLGWRPRFSLEEGLKRTIAWYQQFFQSGEKTVNGKSRADLTKETFDPIELEI